MPKPSSKPLFALSSFAPPKPRARDSPRKPPIFAPQAGSDSDPVLSPSPSPAPSSDEPDEEPAQASIASPTHGESLAAALGDMADKAAVSRSRAAEKEEAVAHMLRERGWRQAGEGDDPGDTPASDGKEAAYSAMAQVMREQQTRSLRNAAGRREQERAGQVLGEGEDPARDAECKRRARSPSWEDWESD